MAVKGAEVDTGSLVGDLVLRWYEVVTHRNVSFGALHWSRHRRAIWMVVSEFGAP